MPADLLDRAAGRRRQRVPPARASRGRDPRQRDAGRSAHRVGVRDGDRRSPAPHQPVRSARCRIAKIAARGLLDARPEPTAPAFIENGVEVRVSDPALAAPQRRGRARCALGPAPGRRIRVDPGLRQPSRGAAAPGPARTRRGGLRTTHDPSDGTAVPALDRPVPQGRAAQGVFLQILERTEVDLEIPDRPFTFGQLIQAQAAGDAAPYSPSTAAPS